MEKNATITALIDELNEATESYNKLQRKSEDASKEVTIALNRCNRIQKEMDTEIKALKASAPNQTDWGHRRISNIREQAAG